MTIAKIIAIDGPAASGKSTLGYKLAQALGYLYFDTGVMYRAITWLALQRGVAISDEAAVTSLAETALIDVRPPSVADGRVNDIVVDMQDITWEIRRPEVDANVSPVSAYPGVRQALSAQQRRIGRRGNVVMVGRDIGTVVLPEAELKIYLDASVEERARRRYLELCQRGEAAEQSGQRVEGALQPETSRGSVERGGSADYEFILNAMRRRDQIDSNRLVAPLRPAEDAHILCSDGLDAEQVFALAKALVFGK